MKHNTLEKMRSWGWRGGCRDQNRQGSFCLFWNKKSLKKNTNKQTNKQRAEQNKIGKRKGAEKERGELLE